MAVPLTKPTVGGSVATWGTTLNTALDALNAAIVGAAKSADQSVTSSVTLANDNDLQLLTAASGVYIVQWSLVTDGAVAGDFQYAFSGAASATMTWESWGQLTTATVNAPVTPLDIAAIGTATAHGTIATGTNSRVYGTGVLRNAGSPGSLVLKWAQGTSSATATRLRAGSWMTATRIA